MNTLTEAELNENGAKQKTQICNVKTKMGNLDTLTTTSLASLVFEKKTIWCVFEKKCEYQICFYLKTEQCEQGGKIASFLRVKTDQKENGLV